MDEIVGTLRQTLVETGLDKNTIRHVHQAIMAITSAPATPEYKRSPHESSIHIPLIMEGPGFNRGMAVSELVSHVDFAPTLLTAAGLNVPAGMQGHNFCPCGPSHGGLAQRSLFEMSEFITGRGLRTPQ